MVSLSNRALRRALYGGATALAVIVIAWAIYILVPDAGTPRDGAEVSNDAEASDDRRDSSSESRDTAGETTNTEDALTVLLAGRDEQSTDSMLLVRVAEGDDFARILSIPRDLWYDGRKLNGHYSEGGPEAMVEAVADITGFAPDHYAVVDMEGFVRIIDHLGGITITLEESLYDDTLLMPDEESWLEFPAGTHEIDGAEALLIARSRATSSDFVRSRRQSRIIEGLQRRISEISLSDVPALFDVVRTVFEYMDTDLSVPQTVGYLLKYGFMEDFERAGLSTDNVLVNDHSLYLPDDRVPWRSDEDPAEAINRRESGGFPEARRPYRGDKLERTEYLAMRDAPRLTQVYAGRVHEREESLLEDREEVDEAMDHGGDTEAGPAAESGDSAGTDPDGAAAPDAAAGDNGTSSAREGEGSEPAEPAELAEPPRPPTELSPVAISLKRRVVEASGISRILPARGLWILLPHDDNRDHIRWYTETFFSGGPPSQDAIETRLGL